ncbi:glycerol-3-phosphate 1-O-acyltransferase PlsY [Bacillus sp. EB01]|uniref:glycerol-3-phosphate 1-O-acyltransferase PlsY n=1 Tax=Bacillus sp. EB01 TaxID=1347086 RepID=UPI0005C47F28|nr:glycerol-3-phosphate 1-O-acyltransferase PlsY [Bacillus sp. EB01]
MVELILLCLLAYLLGSIPSGLIIGKVFYKTDIRQHGSGNLGGTNTFRTLGKKAGFVVTFADILKGTLATALPILLDIDDIHPLLTGMLAVIGHMYPVFAGFRGGKAVATSGGVLLFYAPLMFVIMLGVFFLSLYISKYVSLASMMGGVAAVTYSLVVPPRDVPLIIIVLLLTTFVFYRHRANIGRIINKTEPKVKWL